MPSGRVTRSRNLNNLHVIPTSTADIVNNKSLQVCTLPPTPTMQQPGTTIPVLVPPANPPVFFDANTNNYINNVRRRNRKRKRERKRSAHQNPILLNTPDDYDWFNPSENSKEVADIAPKEETEKVEGVPEVVPPPTEEDFEEVEVASSDGDGKKIPVGFRKTKLHYLNYKNKSFFKPKFYDFSTQRTVINCLNVDDDVSVDVDVVSEAEYDEYETDALDPLEKFGTIIEIEDDEMTDEAEEEIVSGVNDEMEEESTDVLTEESMESTHTVSNEVDKDSMPVTDNEMTDNAKSRCAVIKESNEKDCIVNKEANEKSDILISEEGKEILSENNEISVPKSWISPACIKDNNNLIQGKSLIQDKLDTWGSHLIGLEYLVEICDKNKVSVLNYYCELCDEELDVQELSEAYVINHVCELSHAKKYL